MLWVVYRGVIADEAQDLLPLPQLLLDRPHLLWGTHCDPVDPAQDCGLVDECPLFF